MSNKKKENKITTELKISNTQNENKPETKIENSSEIKKIEIPKVKELTDKEKVEIYKEELLKKDKRITELEKENKLLLDLSMKNAKKRLEELEKKTP